MTETTAEARADILLEALHETEKRRARLERAVNEIQTLTLEAFARGSQNPLVGSILGVVCDLLKEDR